VARRFGIACKDGAGVDAPNATGWRPEQEDARLAEKTEALRAQVTRHGARAAAMRSELAGYEQKCAGERRDA
jgi:hypothetical protein